MLATVLPLPTSGRKLTCKKNVKNNLKGLTLHRNVVSFKSGVVSWGKEQIFRGVHTREQIKIWET